MHEVLTRVDIAASPEQVWDVLTDFDAYADWNPLVPRIVGEPVVGAGLDLDLQLPGHRPIRFRPIVSEVAEAHRFAWRGTLGIRGLFDGHHRFELVATAEGTRFVHAESFSGLLARPVLGFIRSGTQAGFMLMNEALRVRAEARTGAAT